METFSMMEIINILASIFVALISGIFYILYENHKSKKELEMKVKENECFIKNINSNIDRMMNEIESLKEKTNDNLNYIHYIYGTLKTDYPKNIEENGNLNDINRK